MKFKQFVQKWLINNWKYKLLALVFAFVLWLVIVNIQDPEITRTIYGITVTKENVDVLQDVDFVYSVASGETATVVVTGKKSIVQGLSANDFYAYANFEELSITNAIPIKVQLAGSKSVYANDVSIRVQTTSMILTLDDISSKAIPVELVYVGDLPQDKNLENVVVEPAEIEVRAPSKTLEMITKIEAVINTDDIADEVTLRATPVLYDYTGSAVSVDTEDVSTNCSEVLVSFDVSTVKTVELRAGTTGTPADGYEVESISYSFDSIVIKGDDEAVEGLDYIRIPNSRVSLTGAKKDVVVKVDVTEYLPEGVEIFDGNINVVITVRIREKETESTTPETTVGDSLMGETTQDSNKETTTAAAQP